MKYILKFDNQGNSAHFLFCHFTNKEAKPECRFCGGSFCVYVRCRSRGKRNWKRWEFKISDEEGE